MDGAAGQGWVGSHPPAAGEELGQQELLIEVLLENTQFFLSELWGRAEGAPRISPSLDESGGARRRVFRELRKVVEGEFCLKGASF